MSALHVAVRGGSYVCYRTDNGITREYVGCDHATPRAAISHNANTDPYVSPIRDPGSEPPPSRGSSPRLPPAVGSLPGSPKADSRP